MNEGNSSGLGIGCVSWDGEVYPDQFWRNQSLGNVRNRPFSQIWTDEKNELLMKLKEKKKHVHGRCADVCGSMSAPAISVPGQSRREISGDLIPPAI